MADIRIMDDIVCSFNIGVELVTK